jgi:anionic cell wall polymer biosynthesis LytR-Cps2A-Psr (LCP) family protein
MKKIILIILVILVFGLGAWFAAREIILHKSTAAEREKIEVLNKEVEQVLASRRDELKNNEPADPFGKDDTARVLLIGLDKRIGETQGHCDAIQLITIDRKKQEVTITAVPRGTYSPLPPGGNYLPSDYYVSKSCAIGGLEYGITQIEKILGQKADYLVVVGFSDVLGIFRDLNLPTTETLEWLRQRQGYAIGEPQRAHNHSTFIKQMLVKFVPKESSGIDTALEYIIYKIVKTDLSFSDAQSLADSLSAMDLANHQERVHLTMRPAYAVQDIPYAEENINDYLHTMLDPIKDRLIEGDYSGATEEEMQTKILETIDEKKDDQNFVLWAFLNNLWLQIEDKDKRLAIQYDILKKYLPLISEEERGNVISDYILEMEYYGEKKWADAGRALLTKEVGQEDL